MISGSVEVVAKGEVGEGRGEVVDFVVEEVPEM